MTATVTDALVGGATASDALAITYIEDILDLFGSSIVTYLPLNEASGATAADLSGNGRTGTYSGVVLANGVGPDGSLCPYFDGTNDYVDFYSASFNAAFSKIEGSLLIWAKVSALADWTDTILRTAIGVMDTGNNDTNCAKHNANNYLDHGYIGSEIQPNYKNEIGWMLLAVTWSQSGNEVKAYENGVQVETTKVFPGAALTTLSIHGSCAGMARKDINQYPWKGWLAHAVVLDRPATAAEIWRMYSIAHPVAAGSQSDYAIAITFDDGGASLYDNVFSYAESIGIHKLTTFVFPAGTDVGRPTYCTWTELQAMYAAGWDIGNHLHDHDDWRAYSQAQCEATLNSARVDLDAHGLTRASRHVAYPYGFYTADSDAAMIATGMLTGRVADGMGFDYVVSAPALNRLPAITISQTMTLGDVQSRIMAAVTNKTSLILFGHRIVAVPSDPVEWSVANFQALMDWIKLNNIRLMTISELYAAITA